jgi:hypothetical protein
MIGNLSLGTLSVLVLILAALGVCAGFIGLEFANRRERLRVRVAGASGTAEAGGEAGELRHSRS